VDFEKFKGQSQGSEMEQNRNWYNVKRVGRVKGRKSWETFIIVLHFWLQEAHGRWKVYDFYFHISRIRNNTIDY